jgi:hypothetical protein
VTITRQIQTNNGTSLEENNLEMSAWNEPITWQLQGVCRADQEQKWRHLLYRRVADCSLRESIYTIKKSTNKSPNVQIVKGQSSLFKGTVRPDWIRMRVVLLESPLKGHQPLYVFNF